MTKMNNILLMQIRKNSFLRNIILKSQERWGVNLEKILPIPYKKYEDRIVEPIIKTTKQHEVNKKYEQRIIQSSPSKPNKKYEQRGDDWDIEHIKKYGGL
tara:strand:- start:149 stop:448 length:300 start_codon:yes stop_codon:yes gene_type:complete